ncbi:MAG: hypothetical protein L0H55_16570, partial [Candidatus Nitrosocosmicus sp.]|nr:hypothetical protein [Candidatus Nitrosocosmicus sp.]
LQDNHTSNNENETIVKDYSSYFDSSKTLVVVGSVIKQGIQSIPQNVTVGMYVFNNAIDKHELLTEKPYNPVIYNNNEPFPFKFKINTTKYSLNSNSVPFVLKSENASPFTKINTFELKYPVIPQGPNKELRGNITNTSPLPIENLTLFAIVNDNNSKQIDSVKKLIPFLKPYQTINFSIPPNPSIKDEVYFYSCVGGNAADMRIDKYKLFTISKYKVLGYRHSDMMRLDLLNYTENNDRLNIEINNLYPIPGALSIQLMPYQVNPIMVYLDDKIYESATKKYLDDMIQIDMTIPQGSHEVVLTNIEEY